MISIDLLNLNLIFSFFEITHKIMEIEVCLNFENQILLFLFLLKFKKFHLETWIRWLLTCSYKSNSITLSLLTHCDYGNHSLYYNERSMSDFFHENCTVFRLPFSLLQDHGQLLRQSISIEKLYKFLFIIYIINEVPIYS